MSENTTFYKAPRYIFRKLNILRILSKYSDINSFIDIGCGAGELACTLVENGKKGTGIDFSEAAIKTAKGIRTRRNIDAKNLVFEVGDATKKMTNKFDLVICCEVLEHVKNDVKYLNEITKLSNKYLLISVPAKQKLFDYSDEAVGHYRRYEKEDLINLLANNDLEIHQFVCYGYPFTNLVRLARKTVFYIKHRRNKTELKEEKSKDSGINPIKLPAPLNKLDLETWFKPLYWFSLIFNNTNLSEGYLVLCQKKN